MEIGKNSPAIIVTGNFQLYMSFIKTSIACYSKCVKIIDLLNNKVVCNLSKTIN